jgi:hypothetical protein
MDIVMLIKAMGNIFIAAVIFVAMFISAIMYTLMVVIIRPEKRLAFLYEKIQESRNWIHLKIKKLTFASKETRAVH